MFHGGITSLTSVGQNKEDWNQTRQKTSTGWSSTSSAAAAGQVLRCVPVVQGNTCKNDLYSFRKF